MIRSYQQQLPLWFSIGAVVLFAIALLLVLWVIIPIKILSKGLVLFGETEKLKHLAKNKTEFGSFAKLLIEFFHQKESLEKEIKIRKQTDEELRKSESKLHAIFSAMTDIILILDDKGRYLEIAPSNPSLLYRPSNEILGKTMHEVFPKEQADFFLSRVTECLNSMQTVSMEYFLEIDRKKLWFSAILSPLNSNSVLFVARDITETKLAEENLKISDTTFRGILNTINDAIYIQDKDGTFLDVNEGAVQMYGYSREELIGKNPLFVAAEGKNDLQKVVEQVHLAFEGTPQELEFWGKRKNGQIFPKHVRLYKGIYFEKEVVVAVSQDITESKRAEDKLKENEEMFRNLVENITDVFYIADVRGKMKYCSPNFFLFTGFTPQEILNHPYVRVVAPVDQRRVVEHYIGAERSGILDTRIELRVKRKDGIIFWAEQNTRFVRDENGNILEYRTVARDISERKHAEEALKKSEEWFRNLFEKASDGIFHLSLRGELLAVNKAFAMMHGYTVEEMQKMSINDLDTPQTSILFPERMRRVLAGENLTFEVEHYHKNGHTFQLEVTASMITVGNEKFVIAFHRDISERKKAEETIRASEERFRTISYLTSDYIFSTKICSDGKVEPDWVMGAFEKITGYTFEEYKAIGGWYALLHPDDRKKDADDFQKLLNNEKVISEVQIYSKNGSIIWLRTYAQPIWDESSDRISYVHGAVQDITERKYSESLISESEEKFRKIAEGTKAILFNTNTRGQLTYANRAACAMLGLDEENLMGKFYLSFVHPDDRKKVHSYFLSQLKNNEQARSLDFRYVSTAGNIGWLSFLVNILYKDEKIVGLTGVAQDISERKQSEEALKRSEYQYRNLFETANDAIIIFEPETEIILEANPKACEVYGFSKNELIGLSLKTLSINVEAGEKQIQQTLNLKSFKNFETQHINRGGRIISFLINASFIEFEGKPAILSINHDITDRKIAEEKLYNSELQFRTVWENSADGMRLTNSDGIILMVNKAFCKLVDMQKSELEGKAFEVVYRIDTREHISQSHKKSFSLKDVESNFERELLLWNDKRYWFEVTNSFIEIENQPAMLLSIFRDVTQRKLAEFELRKLSEAVEQSPASIVITNLDGNIQYVNKSFREITGYSLDEVTGKNMRIISSGKMSKEKYKDLWETILSGNEWRGEFLNKKKNGELYWEDSIIKPIKDKTGKIISLLGVQEDITLKKQAEQKIQLLAHSLESIGECVSITDTENHLLFVNEAFIKTYGYTKDELFGQNISIVRPDEGLQDNILQILSSTLDGGWKGEVLNKRKDGTIFPVSLSTSVVRDNDGNPIALIGVASDITDMKKSREELILAKEKAEEMNRLKSNFLANMSHELRTPLNGILGFASILSSSIDNPEYNIMAQSIFTSGKRLSETLNLILDLSKAETEDIVLHSKNINITHVVNRVVELFSESAAQKNLLLETVIANENLYAKLDENLFERTINNLVSNAIKFTDNGKISVKAGKETTEGKDWIYIQVKDTGIGIPEDKIDLIWEEFRQVSEGISRSFEGTGLGLTISKRIVELMNGVITVESKVGEGSVFTVKFLASDYIAEVVEVKPEQEVLAANPVEKKMDLTSLHSVLYVEDDLINQNIVKFYLRNFCRVETAKDGKSALQLVAEKKYDLLLMDINLGTGMDGMAVTKEIRKMPQYAETPIVAVTAYAMDSDREEFLSGGCSHYLSKPFEKQELLELIASIVIK
ncbi:MAG: PAS domain S-box protein [Ignavibacteria bacterium]|nr:PAS domain S-box protein [Ignavibacteria bacterium]